MTFDIIVLCGAVVGAMFILIPMKELKTEYFSFAVAGLSVVIFVFSLRSAKPVFLYVNSLMGSDTSSYLKILTKVLGITLVTNLTSELACDLGMSGISGKVEFAGKVGILLSAIPVYEELFVLIGTVL